ncbi:MAG TPA: hypothetical protein VM677_01190 [Actinokineospora sp.]|nr:hypothetical protein [Actinokineospora sp.]
MENGGLNPIEVQRFAVELGLHESDRLAIAGIAVPDHLAPLDSDAGSWVRRLVGAYMHLPKAKRREVRRLVSELPQEKRTRPVRTLTAHQYYSTSPAAGAVLMRMLANRNLGWTQIAKMLLVVTGRYWAASTYGQVGRGVKQVTPDLLIDFSTLLNIPAADLAALTGVPLEHAPSPASPAVEGVGGLIWDVRRLTSGQVQHVHEFAESMRR